MIRIAATVAAALAVLAVYVAVFVVMPKGAFWSPDEGAKYLQLRSLRWNSGPSAAIPYAGAALDPAFAYYPTHCRYADLYPVPLPDGGVKFHWPIWFSLVTRPFVSLFGLNGLYVLPLLAGWLVALFGGLLARHYHPGLAPLAILIIGLATPIAFFSLTHWEHTLATLLALSALTLACRNTISRLLRRWLALPLLLGACVLRIEIVPFAVALAVAVATARGTRIGFRPSWRLLLAGLGLAALLAGIALALPARHLWLLQSLPEYLRDNLSRLPHLPGILASVLIEAPGNQSPHLSWALRVTGLITFATAAAAAFLPSPRLVTVSALAGLFAALDFTLYLVLLPQPYMTLHGLLPIAPFTVLAAYAVADARRERRYDLMVLTTTAWLYLLLAFAVIFTFTVEVNGHYRTGLEWGNRYLLTLYPLAAVLALGGVRALRRLANGPGMRAMLTVIAGALFLCGAQMQARGFLVLVQSRALVASWQRSLEGPLPVVTDVWWLPASMAPFFATHPMFCVLHPDELADWYPAALAAGVDGFVFATFHEFEPSRFAAPGLTVDAIGEQLISGLHVRRFRVARPAGGDDAHG